MCQHCGVDVDVVDNEQLQRYEGLVGGEVAGTITYRVRPDGVRVLLHTEVEPAYEGKGIGSRLVHGALDAERAGSRRIVASCPYASAYVTRHPEYQDLLA